jgi:hypothetical protein
VFRITRKKVAFGETEATKEEYKKKSKRKNEDEDSEMSIVVVFFGFPIIG